ncbi:hypothetical protein E2320_016237 [Naja naja]|nr:hypothetical protein E2320_016237 [Naja naja]
MLKSVSSSLVPKFLANCMQPSSSTFHLCCGKWKEDEAPSYREHLFPPKLVSRLKQEAFAIYNTWLSGCYFEYSYEGIGMEGLKDKS